MKKKEILKIVVEHLVKDKIIPESALSPTFIELKMLEYEQQIKLKELDNALRLKELEVEKKVKLRAAELGRPTLVPSDHFATGEVLGVSFSLAFSGVSDGAKMTLPFGKWVNGSGLFS